MSTTVDTQKKGQGVVMVQASARLPDHYCESRGDLLGHPSYAGGIQARVFSQAGNVVTKKRNRLGSDSVDALVFLNGFHEMT